MDTSDSEDLDIPHADDLDDCVNEKLYKEVKTELSREISLNLEYLKKGEKLEVSFYYGEGDEESLHSVLKKVASELKSKNYGTDIQKITWKAYELTFWRKKKEEEFY